MFSSLLDVCQPIELREYVLSHFEGVFYHEYHEMNHLIIRNDAISGGWDIGQQWYRNGLLPDVTKPLP